MTFIHAITLIVKRLHHKRIPVGAGDISTNRQGLHIAGSGQSRVVDIERQHGLTSGEANIRLSPSVANV